jgi:hypothetical protein
MNNLEYVLCIWDDSVTHGNSWTDINEINVKSFDIPTAGLLIDETKEHILIALAYKEDKVMSPLQIPKSSIKKLKKYRFKLR